MIGITYRNQSLYIPQGFSADLELTDDLMNTGNIPGEASSYPITLPREGNHHLLDFAGHPTTPGNYKTYDDFAITWAGMVWWEVSFVHKRTTTYVIEGYFTSVASPFFGSKDTSIRTLLHGVRWKHPFLPEDPGYTYLPAYFPEFAFYGETKVYNRIIQQSFSVDLPPEYEDFIPPVDDIDYELMSRCPAFRVEDLLRACCKAIGMQLEDNYSESGSDLSKLILLHNRIVLELYSPPGTLNTEIDDELDVSLHVTDITLLQLCSIAAGISGSKMAIGLPDHGILQINNHERIAGREPYDLRDDEPHEWETDPVNAPPMIIKYDLSDDSLLKDTAEPTGKADLGPFSQLADLDAVATDGDYGFVRQENAWYQCLVLDNDSRQLVRRGTDCLPYATLGNSNTDAQPEERKIPACPVEKHAYLYDTIDQKPTMEKDVQHITLRGWERVPEVYSGYELLFFEELDDNEDPEYAVYYREITEVADTSVPADFYIRLGNDEWTRSVNISSVVIRRPIDRYLPIIGANSFRVSYVNLGEELKVPRLLIYHGMQPTITGGTYAMAGPDNLDSLGNKIGTYTLNTSQPGSMIRRYYDALDAFRRNTLRIFSNMTLSPKQIKEAFARRMVVGRYARMRISSIATRLTSSGAEETEIQGYRE